MSEHYIYQTNVKKEWVDYNGHMNDAEYNRVFSDATDAWLALIGLNQETIHIRKSYNIFKRNERRRKYSGKSTSL